MKVKVTRKKNGSQRLRYLSGGAAAKCAGIARHTRQPYPTASKSYVVPRRAKRGA